MKDGNRCRFPAPCRGSDSKNPVATGLLSLLFLFLVITPAIAANITTYFNPRTNRYAEVADGEILVKFKKGTSPAQVRSMMVGSRVLDEIEGLGIIRMKIPSDKTVQEMVEEYENNPNVEYVEPNYVGYCFKTPDDPYFNQQWGLESASDKDVDAPEAWDIDIGDPGVVIAILDTGIELNHPDLKDKIVSGWDFVNNDNDPSDDNGHGTHVAGIAAASTDNGLGIAGVSWKSKLMPVKVMDASGTGYYSDWINGIVYAVDSGAKVLNMSLGGTQDAVSLKDAIDYATDRGCVVCAAMGNLDQEITFYPAGYTNTIAVGATDEDDTRCDVTDWGKDPEGNDQGSSYGNHIDVVAPGNNILSTSLNSSLLSMSGTSMATPFVSGLAALIISRNWTKGPDEIKTIIRNTAEDLETAGWDKYHGSGRINIYNALNSVEKGPPRESTLKIGNNRINPHYNQRSLIHYELSRADNLSIRIYNLAGEEVKVLYNDWHDAGRDTAEWLGKNADGQTVGSGVYFVVLKIGSDVTVKRIMVVK